MGFLKEDIMPGTVFQGQYKTELQYAECDNAEGYNAGYIETDTFIEYTLSDISLLSKREREILSKIVAGHTNKEIALLISRSERTVEYHRNRLMKKLNAHNAANLVKRAILMGIE